MGRITSGVKLINLDEKVKVVQIAKVRERVFGDEQELEGEDVVEDSMEDSVVEEESTEESENQN